LEDSRSNLDDQVKRDEEFKDLIEVAENINKKNEIIGDLSEKEKKEIQEGV
jgi:hypothetical protein